MYTITKTFISGNLKGLTITEHTPVRFDEGFVCKKPCAGGSGYRIDLVVEEK